MADPTAQTTDPTKPKLPAPLTMAQAAPASSAQAPGQAGGTPSLTMAQTPVTTPAPTVAAPTAPVDRVKLATDIFNTTAASTAPAYEAAQRGAVSTGAGLGQLGSGQLRTSEGNLELARERDLDTLRSTLVNSATQGSIEDANTAFQQQIAGGGLSIAQQNANTTQTGTLGGLGIQQGQLDLAKTGQEAQIELAKKSLEQSGIQFNATLAEQQAARLQQGSQFNAQLAQSGDQFKQSLAQNAEQFGLSQTQAMALAKLNDATANRSIDVSQEQGKNQLLIQLAGILGGPTGTLNPGIMAGIAKLFGITLPADTTTTGTGGGSGGGGTGTGTGGGGTTDGGTGGSRVQG